LKNLTLKRSIFIFYSIFGLLPLVAVSYITLLSYTRSISTLTDQHVSQLMRRAGTQMENRCTSLFNYLELLAKTPFVQLAFLQYPQGGQGSTVPDKLELFRLNAQAFERITLYSAQGQALASTPYVGPAPKSLSPRAAAKLIQFNLSQEVRQEPGGTHLLFYKAVFDFYKPQRVVGLVCGRTSLKRFVDLFANLKLGPGVHKFIKDGSSQVLFEHNPDSPDRDSSLREYSAELPLLNWNISARIPESVLYRDVYKVRDQTLVIAGFVAVVAVLAGLVFSRRVTKPMETIIQGTREFASGNTGHRIPMPNSRETRRVAEAFNTMAAELTERQAELVQAGKLASLGLLSAGFAHEVRNPLAGIKTSAQVLERRGNSPQERSLARGISKEVDRLNKIVEDLLHFSRPSQSRRVPCDLSEVTDRSLSLLEARFRQRRVAVDNRVNRLLTLADPDQIIQVMINLMLNALHAVEPDSGRIALDSGLDGNERPFLSIRDNGRGMPPEMVARIFDPFFSDSQGGTGLGLSIVQTLLRQNGIKLDVQSREGQGSTFKLTFRRARPEYYEVSHG
jgi:two-component system NtrC family sensor kinase